jgi:uncharacterized phage-associated protein
MAMQRFAHHVIAVANEFNGISNLQLQKIMYFALGDYIKEHGIDNVIEEIYDEPFEVWPYGPVVNETYHHFKKYGQYKIRESFDRFDDYEVLTPYIVDYLDKDVIHLVRESHKHNTWINNINGSKTEYRLEDLQDDFAG